MSTPIVTPAEIKKLGDRAMKISWSDGSTREYTARDLRAGCRCAACKNELTGEQLLKVETLPKEMKILKSEVMGNYALGFQFSDGHGSGIYTFDHLRKIGINTP